MLLSTLSKAIHKSLLIRHQSSYQKKKGKDLMKPTNMDTIEKIFSNLKKCTYIDVYSTRILAIMMRPSLTYPNHVNSICNYHRQQDKKQSPPQTKERRT